MADVTGEWVALTIDHFVDEFIGKTRFGSPSAVLDDVQPIIDLGKAAAYKAGMLVVFAIQEVQSVMLEALSLANRQPELMREETIRQHVEALFKKYGLQAEIK